MSRVPRIRFKGFEEDWEQRKLGEVANRFDSTRIPISENLRVSGKTPYYGANGIQDYVDGYTHDGEYVLIAEDGANDLKNYPIRLVKGRIWVNNHAHVIQGMEKFMNNQFINFAMSQVDFESIVVGCGRAKLNAEQLMDICFKIPNKNEQANIGRLFESINHLITLHQRKLEKLKIIKKSMLENLFPQNGEKTPKIRFSGFTEDWEQRKLGEYLIQYTEVTIINDQYPVLTSSRKGIFFQKDYYDGNQIASENNIGYNIVPYGYFTYRHMSDDEIFYFNINNIIDNGIVSTLYPVFTTNNRLDSKFLQYELNFGKEFRKYSVLQKQGGSRTYMYFNKLRDLKLTITTSLKEQEYIRNLICSIDHLITLHQSKLDKLQKIKKSMLESMFV